MELRHLAAEPVGGVDGADVVGSGHAVAHPGRGPRHPLDLIGARRAAGRRMAREIDHRVRRRDREKGRYHRRPVDLGVGRLDPVAEIGAERDGLHERLQALGLDRRPIGRDVKNLAEVSVQSLRDVPRRRIGAIADREEQIAVAPDRDAASCLGA